MIPVKETDEGFEITCPKGDIIISKYPRKIFGDVFEDDSQISAPSAKVRKNAGKCT